MSRLHKFLCLSHADRFYLLEAAVWLGLARLALLILPFRWIALWLGRHMALAQDLAEGTPAELLTRISWGVTTAGCHLPWDCTCLTQAMAGKAMLKCRGVPSTLCLGVAKDEETYLQAHAWLRCGDRILTGWQGIAKYTVIATFAEDGK
jgi:hypothetical protein